jgi:DNA polymerase-3 subunit gamma/tau
LFYQIGLLGRKDLPLAPEPRGGFEMVMLRMLAFRPQTTNAAPATPSPSRPATPALPSTPETPTAAPRSPMGNLPPSSPPAATGDWGQLIRQLRLGGITKALADNCVLQSHDGNHIHLSLAPEHESMKTPQQEKRLQEMLSQHFGENIKLRISVGNSHASAQASPAVLQRQAEQSRFDAAMTDLENDPLVQEIKTAFDAEIDRNSVRLDGTEG